MSLKNRLFAIVAIACVFGGMAYVALSGMSIGQKIEDGSFSFRKKETIYFWYSDSTMTDFISGAAVAFGEQNDVRVIPVLTSDSDYLEAINRASLSGEQIPDAYMISNDSLGKAFLAGLASRVEDETGLLTTEHFPQTALDAITYKDKQIAYPYYYNTSILLFNKTYLEEWTAAQLAATEEGIGEEPFVDEEEEAYAEGEAQEETLEVTPEQIEAGIPVTTDEILAFAGNYDAPENVEAVFKWDVSDIFYNYYFVGRYMIIGGESGDDETQINIYNEETKQCLEQYQALNQFFFIDADTVTSESVLQEFIEGKLVFTVVTPSALAQMEQAKEDGTFAYEFGVALMPQPSADLGARSLSVTSSVAINGYSEHKELANQFAVFLTGDKAKLLYERTGKVSANLAANTDNEHLMVFMEEYKNSISLPKMIETSNFWLHLEIVFSKIWEGADVDAQLLELSDQILSQVE